MVAVRSLLAGPVSELPLQLRLRRVCHLLSLQLCLRRIHYLQRATTVLVAWQLRLQLPSKLPVAVV